MLSLWGSRLYLSSLFVCGLLGVSASISEAASNPKHPSEQTLIFYNARMALREGKPKESLKLWLLRNMVESKHRVVSAHDAEFRSVVWAALGDAGFCQDGYVTDEEGAGLWPLAVHNWLVRNMRRDAAPEQPAPFESFDIKQQRRRVSLHDILDVKELKAVRFFRTPCWQQTTLLLNTNHSVFSDEVSDKEVGAKILRYLLHLSRDTMVEEKFRGAAVIDARIFDLNLKIREIAERKKRKQRRAEARKARARGISKEAVHEIRNNKEEEPLTPNSEEAKILARSLHWPVSEWLSLERERRLFLFAHAAEAFPSPFHNKRIRPLLLGIIDRLIETKKGADLNSWIGYVGKYLPTENPKLIWGGERGKSLLALEPTTGFKNRAVIALHRGVHALSLGDLPNALRSFAYALHYAPDANQSEVVSALSRRWLSFVASQFEVTEELLSMLQRLVPKRAYGMILEDLLWHAALHADQASFQRCVNHHTGRGALNERIELLYPLALGKTGRFARSMGGVLNEYPYFALRFIKKFIARLETQNAQVRGANLRTIRLLRELLLPLTIESGGEGGQARTASDLVARMAAFNEGLTGIQENSRGLSTASEVFAGSVRLAPSDPLPWPFTAPLVRAPSVFTPILLVPEEWQDSKQHIVFGWRVGR